MTTTRLVAAAAALLTAASVTVAAGPAGADGPRLVDLGTLPGGHNSVVLGGDGTDLWVGASDDGSGREHAVYWTGTRIHDLGLPTSSAGDLSVSATSANRHDVIAANAPSATGNPRAYLWQSGRARMLRLPARATADWSSTVARVKDSGVAVGAIGEFPGPNDQVEEHPTIWTSVTAAPRLLSFPEAYDGGVVEDINSHGVAVGYVFSDIQALPWQWDANGHGHAIDARDAQGQAFVVDDAGVVAGTSDLEGTLDNGSEATIWRSGREQGVSDGLVFTASNYRGSYVGAGFGDGTTECCALIYRGGSTAYTVLPLSRHLGDATQAWTVTAGNTVGGTSDIGNGDMHATLWTHAFQQGFVPPASGMPASTHRARTVAAPVGWRG